MLVRARPSKPSALEHKRGYAVLYNRSFDPPQANLPVRHRCRNPRCAAQLKPAVANPRDAFCCQGCFGVFYRRRCLVCERPIIRQTERQILCGRVKCKRDFQRHRERFLGARYLPSVLVPNASRSAHSTGLKIGTKSGRPFAQIAGSGLTSTSLRLASFPPDPELAARLERAHRPYFEALRKSEQAAARRALIKRHHPPVNILGGHCFANAPALDLSPLPEPEWAVPSNWKPATTAAAVSEDVPAFLRRSSHDPPPPPERPAVCHPVSSRKPQSNSWTSRASQDRAEAWVSLRLSRGNP